MAQTMYSHLGKSVCFADIVDLAPEPVWRLVRHTLALGTIFILEELAEAGLSRKVHQYFAVLTNNRSVGVMGDFRTYDYTLAIRAVRTNDFMTCEYARLPHTLLSRMSTRITNEVQGVNRVVYDITGKPPATIEWE